MNQILVNGSLRYAPPRIDSALQKLTSCQGAGLAAAPSPAELVGKIM
jgi:hypothetical protein